MLAFSSSVSRYWSVISGSAAYAACKIVPAAINRMAHWQWRLLEKRRCTSTAVIYEPQGSTARWARAPAVDRELEFHDEAELIGSALQTSGGGVLVKAVEVHSPTRSLRFRLIHLAR